MKCLNNDLDRYNKKRMIIPKSEKNAQATVFIILAIAIVVGVVLFFVFRGGLSFGGPPSDLEPVYTYYLNCIEQEVKNGAAILGQQGGYIEGPDFVAGSAFMPFSNYLNFVGIPIPYWYYISGNNVVREQVPSYDLMEEELDKFLEQSILINCRLDQFIEEGFLISLGEEVIVESDIKEREINVNVKQSLDISRGESSWSSSNHDNEVDSNFGKSYELASKIYGNFKETSFLENYGVDILRLYAPVDGVKIQCNPAIWNFEQVRENVTLALEANVPFTKIKGDYYDLRTQENEYFIQDIGEEVNMDVNFLFSRDWPNKMEVWPNEGGVLMAEPVGNEEGFGMLGFCYVPYHFVYDLAYPVLVQINDGEQIFQFPVVVYVNKNRPREPIAGSVFEDDTNELCQYKNTEIEVATFNTNLEPVESIIDFKCFDEVCNIGRTESSGGEAVLVSDFPQCKNGYLIARANGYETKKEVFSTIEEGSVALFLDRLYPLELEIEGISESESAVITFTKDDKVTTLAYPEQDSIELSSGQYEVKMYVYSNAEIRLSGSSEQKCVEVSKSGFSGFFGGTDEKCFNIDVPSQTVDKGISGGGTQNYFVSESELSFSKKIIIAPGDFGIPRKVEDLQINYNRVETENLIINFE